MNLFTDYIKTGEMKQCAIKSTQSHHQHLPRSVQGLPVMNI